MSKDYLIHNGQLVSTDELYHYGVLGMKWGVRRGKASKAYDKASKKLKKLENKVTKFEAKSKKKLEKAEKARYGWGLNKQERYRKAKWKAGRARFKADKTMKKAIKWLDKMDKTFKGTNVKISAQQKNLGKQYMNALRNRTENVNLI